MSSHTPAPWSYEKSEYGDNFFYILSPNGHCEPIVHVSLQPNTEANARLIAAAPELLAALQKLLNECDGEAFASTGTAKAEMLFEHASTARAAIAKATGA